MVGNSKFKTVIWDIDGTLTHGFQRLPINLTCKLYREQCADPNVTVILLTGRAEAHRPHTTADLAKNNLDGFDQLLVFDLPDCTRTPLLVTKHKHEKLKRFEAATTFTVGNCWADVGFSIRAHPEYDFRTPFMLGSSWFLVGPV